MRQSHKLLLIVFLILPAIVVLVVPVFSEQPEPSPIEIKEALKDILNQGEFRATRVMFLWQKLYEKFINLPVVKQIIKAIEGIVEWLEYNVFRLINSLPVIFKILMFLCILISIGALVTIIIILLKPRFQREKKVSAVPVPMAKVTYQDMGRLAKENLEDKQYKEAIRYLYISLLLYMDSKGIIRYSHVKTNRENLIRFKAGSDVGGPVIRFTELFERKYYGLERCHSEDYEKASNFYNEVITEINR